MVGNSNNLVFRDNVRVFDNGNSEIRLRIGVFNYEEAELDLSTLSENLASFMRKVIELLQSPEGYNPELINEFLLEPYEKEVLQSLLGELQATNYVTTLENRNIDEEITLALLGYLQHDEMDSEEDAAKKRVLFFADDDYAASSAKALATEMKFNLELMSNETLQEVKSADLTTNMDGLAGVQQMSHFREMFGHYDAIVGCMKNLSVGYMRNLNRISVELEIPVVMAFIDGPVVCILATNPYTTGCLECFELRALSRLEDHVQYHNFVKVEKDTARYGSNNKGIVPLLNVLVNLAVSEAYLIRKIGVSKFTGRLLTIYLPTLEIQAQDILRVPFCPACGAVAKVKLEEKNISSRALVDEIVANALKLK